MAIDELFSTPIGCYTGNYDLLSIEKWCYNEMQKNEGKQCSNLGGWQSYDYTGDDLKQTPLKELCDGINEPARFDGTTFSNHTTSDDASPAGAKFSTDFRNHQFYGGFPSSNIGPNKLLFSEPNVDNRFRSASGSGTINVGFDVTGIAKFRDSLY